MKLIVFMLLALFSSNFANSQNLTYTTNWLGNSGAQDHLYVQEEILNMWVSPEGTSYTATWWDENKRLIGVYDANGAILPRLNPTNDFPFGTQIGGNSTSVYSHDGPTLYRYLRSDGGQQSAIDTVPGTAIDGIAASSTEVFVSSSNGRIYVYNATSLAAVRNFNVGGAGRVALDGAGFLWVITGPTTIKRYSTTGGLQPQSITLPAGNIAAALTVNTANNTLYVIDRGPDQNIKVYNNVTSSPSRTSDFGVVGGIYSGTTPGLVGAQRFSFNIVNDPYVPGHTFSGCGIGTDTNGNIYVLDGTTSGANIQKYNSSGAFQWRLIGHTFEEAAYIDPTSDGTDIYAGAHHYKMNYGAAVNTEMASWYGWGGAINQSNAYNAIPQGVSFGGISPFRIAVIAGSKFMYMSAQKGETYVYRMPSNSETLVNCGITDQPDIATWSGRKIYDVDATGTIWSGDNANNTIAKYPCTGVSAGKPTYNMNAPTTYPKPAPYANTAYVGLNYIAETDVMYLVGLTTGTTNESKVSRYNNWSTSRTLVYTVDMFFNGSGTNVESWDVAGDYIFTDYFGGGPTSTTGPGFGLVKVWNANTGAFVMDMKSPANYYAGDSDNINNTKAFKRSNGEYIITFLDHLENKTVVFRWSPGGITVTAPTVTTTTISAITSTTASSGGNITADGGASVTARGVCWSTTANPTTANSKTTNGTGTGTFTSSITGLTANTDYNVRAYATNSAGTSYGSNITFRTAAASTGTWNKIENTAPLWVTNIADTYSQASNSGGSTWSLWRLNASAQYTFTGTQIRIYSYREPGMATGNIYIDNVLVGSNVAWSKSPAAYQQLVWTSATLSNASHTIKIVTTGDYVEVDYLTVLQASAAATISSTTLSSDVSIVDASTSLNAVSVYPNPASSFVNIDFGQNLGSGQARVEVLDMQGRKVYASGLISVESPLQLNTSEYSKGVYLIRISRGTESVTKKLMIE